MQKVTSRESAAVTFPDVYNVFSYCWTPRRVGTGRPAGRAAGQPAAPPQSFFIATLFCFNYRLYSIRPFPRNPQSLFIETLLVFITDFMGIPDSPEKFFIATLFWDFQKVASFFSNGEVSSFCPETSFPGSIRCRFAFLLEL